MNRIHQDHVFTVSGIAGRPLLRLCGAVDADLPANAGPIVVYALLDNPREWHRFFLDVGAGFWDATPGDEIADEFDDDAYRIVDYLDCSTGYHVHSAYGFERLPDLPTQITVELSGDTNISLRCLNDNIDGGTELLVVARTGG
ncbi:MAG: hypothetical protein ACI9HK_001558 [Pirellulaceae bacterium]